MRLTGLTALLTLAAAPSLADVPRVVADVPVNHALAAIVMGDLGQPVLLLDRGGDAHDFQLRPSQASEVAGADLVIWTGEALSPWMADIVGSLASGQVLELASVEGLIQRPMHETAVFGAAEDEHDHDHDHDHDHGDVDPHLWMNTANAALWLGAIAVQLAEIDPDNAETYVANASVGAGAIAQLGAELAMTLAPAQGAGLVMHHDAYGYFADQFGLTILGTIAAGDAADPGAASLQGLRDSLSGAGAVCIFPEVNHSDAFARVVAEGTSLRIGAALDPEGVSLEPGPALYGDLMRGLAAAITACVQGG